MISVKSLIFACRIILSPWKIFVVGLNMVELTEQSTTRLLSLSSTSSPERKTSLAPVTARSRPFLRMLSSLESWPISRLLTVANLFLDGVIFLSSLITRPSRSRLKYLLTRPVSQPARAHLR